MRSKMTRKRALVDPTAAATTTPAFSPVTTSLRSRTRSASIVHTPSSSLPAHRSSTAVAPHGATAEDVATLATLLTDVPEGDQTTSPDGVSSIRGSTEENAPATTTWERRTRRRAELTAVEEDLDEVYAVAVDDETEVCHDYSHDNELELVAVEELHRPGFANTGIIESIHLVNFMSHENFKLNFGPNVNIIHGPNGSGKSAIVSALLIGLGVRTKERGDLIADHIKHGEKEATISITIANRPPEFQGDVSDRYKHHVYGDSITVERRLVRPPDTAKSPVVIKDHNRNVVALPNKMTASHEVASILDHYNIMVDNPAALLTQNYCKQFLIQATPKKMHSLFMRATMFQHWEDYIQDSCIEGDYLRAFLAKAKRGIGELHRKNRELEKKLKAMQNLSKLKTKVKQLRALYAWVYVANLEAQVEAFNLKIADLSKKIDQKRSRIGDISAEIESISEDIAEKQQMAEKISDRLQAVAREDRRFEEGRRNIQKRLRKAQGEVKHLKAQESDCSSQLESLKLAAQKARNDYDELKEQHRQHTPAVSDLQGRLAESQSKLVTLLEAESRTKQNIETLQVDHDRQAAVVRQVQDQLSTTQHDLMTLRRATANHLKRWGSHIFDICSKIEKNKRKFTVLPVGPLGAYVSVTDTRWTKAIQTCFGTNLLSTFVVHNSQDEQILRRLSGNRVSMIVTSLEAPRYHVNLAGRKTVLHAIDVSHAAVYNALVDHGDADRHFFLEPDEDFERIAYSGDHEIMACWNTNADRAYSRYGSRVFRAGPKNVTPLLATDTKADVIEQEANMLDLENRVRELNVDLAEVEGRLQSERQRYDLVATEVHRTTQEEIEIRGRIREVDILSRDQTEDMFDSSSWDVEIARLRKELGLVEEHMEQKLSDVSLEKANLEELTLQHTKSVADRAETVSLREKMTGNAKEAWNQVAESGAEKARYERLVQSLGEELKTTKKCLSEKLAEGEEQRNAAFGMSATRLTSRRTLMDIQDEMERFEHRIDNEKRRFDGKDFADVENEFLSSKLKLLEMEKEQLHVTGLESLVNSSHPARIVRYQSVLKSTKRIANLQFGNYLARRQNTGSLDFDPERQTLQLIVNMATNDRSKAATTDLGSLSGGERSYATLSFLMAMGESMEIPFRLMDEFDVFMDEANRSAALRMLVGMAVDVPHRQFIFLTPNDLPQLPPVEAEAIKIFRLNDPRSSIEN